MQRGFWLIVLAAFVLAAAGESGATAGPLRAFKQCDAYTAVLCGSVVVPLDATGRHPGSVRLHVEELPAPSSTPPKVMLMVAGGPGQASAQAFDLRGQAYFWRSLFPGYTLVTYDDRGTGDSGRISCPELATVGSASPSESAAVVGRCGRSLGGRSWLYSTRANASDMDSVRQAIGADKIALYGVSYGTKQVLGYALRFPAHVERIVLDSTVGATWPDDYYSGVLAGIPHGLDQLCSVGCKGLQGTVGRNLVTLANELAENPIAADVPRPGEPPAHVRVDGYALLALALDTDLEPGIAVQLPADLSAALAGEPQALERLVWLQYLLDSGGSLGIDLAVNVATECADGRFFWPASSSVGSRTPLLHLAFASLAPGATGPFGSWAELDGVAQECVDWPPANADSSLPAGPYPDVPVLILSGSRDIRTPTTGARKVAAKFRHSHLVVIPGSGHAVTAYSRCADRVVAKWLEGRATGGCARQPLFMAPLGAAPTLPVTTTGPLSAAETLKLAAYTLREAETTALAAGGLNARVAGLAGGSLRPDRNSGARLVHYADIAGVALDGVISPIPTGNRGWIAYVTVAGSRAVPGVITERQGRLTSSLGGG